MTVFILIKPGHKASCIKAANIDEIIQITHRRIKTKGEQPHPLYQVPLFRTFVLQQKTGSNENMRT
jgi:hypothetical protein